MPVAARISRRPQFGLRTLLVAVFVVSLPLALLASRERQYRMRVEAVRILTTDLSGIRVGVQTENPEPNFASDVGGEEGDALTRDDVVTFVSVWGRISAKELAAILCFPTLRMLRLSGSEITDTQLRELAAGLPLVERLELQETKVTDEGVRHLGTMHRLRFLNLRDTMISGSAFNELGSLSKLEELDLSGTQFTDDGARHLAALGSLRVLDLSETRITDEGVRCLATLTSLNVLHLSYTQVTGSAFEHLKSLRELGRLSLRETLLGVEGARFLSCLPSLDSLNVGLTTISGEELEHFSTMGLRDLDLDQCPISDADLPPLARMRNLNGLDLMDTLVTAKGIANLHAQRPDMFILWGPIGNSIRVEPQGRRANSTEPDVQ